MTSDKSDLRKTAARKGRLFHATICFPPACRVQFPRIVQIETNKLGTKENCHVYRIRRNGRKREGDAD